MEFYTINPAEETILNSYKEESFEEIRNKILLLFKNYNIWRKINIEKRLIYFEKLIDLLEKNKLNFANLMTSEMGKPISQSIAEIDKCKLVTKYYIENAEKFLKDIEIKTEMSKSYITFQPLGVIFSIMPWNFPFWQVFRFVIPSILAGNTVLLKHAPNTSGVGVAIQNLFKETEFPVDVLLNIIVSPNSVPGISEKIIANHLIRAVTFTGSSNAGSYVASWAGKYLKKSVMELGGSDPYIILSDADLDLAAEQISIGKLINSGQSCIAAKRILVQKNVKNEFVEKFFNSLKSKPIGNPLDEKTYVGPIARKDLMLNLKNQVEKSIKNGASKILVNEFQSDKGYYHPVIILDNVKPKMPAFDEELFGPVASIIEFKTFEEALNLANSSNYGLGAAVFSNDLNQAELLAKYEIESGTVQVNDFVRSDPRLPFGGIKQSGYGRELSEFGIKEFVNIKTISIK